MIFQYDEEKEDWFAILKKEDGVEQIKFHLLFCDNPVCACNTVHINLLPPENSQSENTGFTIQVSIDVVEKKLAYPPGRKIPKELMAFAKGFLHELDEKDYGFLCNQYFAYKNEITEKAGPDEIDAAFDYKAVEKEGVMYAYRDVLPFGEQFTVTIDGKKYILFDSYCLRSGCKCTDTILSMFSAEPSTSKKPRTPVCEVALTYAIKSWAPYQNRELSIPVKTARATVETQIPGFYKKVKQRHLRLKSIYAHCKKKYFSPAKPEPVLPSAEPARAAETKKIGRNAPCPCGSGKKYKKCCMGKEN